VLFVLRISPAVCPSDFRLAGPAPSIYTPSVISRTHHAAVRALGAILTFCVAGSIARSDVAKPVRFDPADPPRTMHLNWSEPIDGVRVRLICVHPVVRVGQSIELSFKLENCGKHWRSVQLPMVRTLIVGADQPSQPNAVPGRAGDLVITAEPLDRAGKVQFSQPLIGLRGFPTYSVAPGKLIWVTITAAAPGPAMQMARGPQFAGRGGNVIMHVRETTQFPGLNRPGRYRLTASYSAADPALDAPQQQLQLGADPSNLWVGRIESPAIDIEVLGDAPGDH
jgi:hypothetical protein